MSTDRHPEVPLKQMDAALLTLDLHKSATRFLTPAGVDRVVSAATAAAHLHRDQKRSVRGDLPVVPYIEHPLRNTVRLTRWGITDADLLCASLLHDVPEDCAQRAVELYAGNAPGATRTEQTLAWIGDAYGSRVATTVAAVTNPPREPGMSDAARLEQYAQHVAAAVRDDPHALLVKASDLTDNAGSLPHQLAGVSPEFVTKRVNKYAPVVEILHTELTRAADGAHVSPEVARSALHAIENLRTSLRQLATRDASFPSPPSVSTRADAHESPRPHTTSPVRHSDLGR